MKKFGRFLGFVVSFFIFIVLLLGTVIFISQKMFKDRLNDYIDNNDILTLNFGSIIENNSLKDIISTVGKNNNMSEEEINNLLTNEQFNLYLKETIKHSFNGYEVTVNIDNLVSESFKEEINNIVSFNDIIVITNFSLTNILLIVLGLTLLTALLSFSLYYPLLYLGIPSIIMGVLLLVFKYNENILIDLLNQSLLLDSNLINTLLTNIINMEGLYLIIFGLVLIILFIVIKRILSKKQLEETRRINIEDINI